MADLYCACAVTRPMHNLYTAQSFRFPPYYLISQSVRPCLIIEHVINFWSGKCPMTDCYNCFCIDICIYPYAIPQNRVANTWIAENGTYQRQLTKAYGIRINIIVLGMVCLSILMQLTSFGYLVLHNRAENLILQLWFLR